MPVLTRTFVFEPATEVRDEIVNLWVLGLKSRKWKMVEGMTPIDWDDVRRKAIEAWFPQLAKISIRYAIKYAARLAEVEGTEWKSRYLSAVSSDRFDSRLEERKKRYKSGGVYTIGSLENITKAVEFVEEKLLASIDPALGRYLKASLVARYVNHAVELMFVSIGIRNGYIDAERAEQIRGEINGKASQWWNTINLPAGFAIVEDWAYKTNIDGSEVTITITRPE